MVDKMFYNKILAQTFSPCGNYLLAGNTFGEIVVYDLQEILSPGNEKTPKFRPPFLKFSTSEDETQICSLATTDDFLIVGTVGEILGFHWETIITMKNPALSWKIILPSNKDELDKADVNSMTVRPEEDRIYAGCGDNKIYCYDLDGGKLIRTFQGHEDYIHCIHSITTRLVSASEDGTARIWDPRMNLESQIIKPYLESTLSRPALGRWLGAASISEDWMVCGGGPYLSLWHMRSMVLTEAYTSLTDNGIHVAKLYDDRVLAGGASPYLTHLSLTGTLVAQVPTSSTCLYSVVLQEKPHKILSMAGSSSKIDICTNFNYRDQILTFIK